MMTPIPTAESGKPAIDVASELTQAAGGILRSRFRSQLDIKHKGRADVVTNVDMEVERFIVSRLREEFPSCAILAEESGKGGAIAAEWTWIIDPLDGTRNYSIGVPHFATTMALARGDEVYLGLTYDPLRDELFKAVRGEGASLNSEPMRVSPVTRLADAVIGTDMGYSDAMGAYALQLLSKLWPGVQTIRVMGSAALGLAYAASGRLGLYFHHLLSPWDIAAGILMAQESGAIVTDRNGKPTSYHTSTILLGNPQLHAEFLQRTNGLPWRTAEV
ncbi:MAG: inositol monophosphatase [Chloroflexi bacterium]|nr:inositol monophosphatase [Chloroflexota bacterium]